MDQLEREAELLYPNTNFPKEPGVPQGEAKPGMVYDKTQFRRDPNLERLSEEAGRTFAKSMKADAYEMIFIPRQTDEIYDATDPGEARLRRNEAPSFIAEEIVKEAETGNFLKTLEHYERFLESVSGN